MKKILSILFLFTALFITAQDGRYGSIPYRNNIALFNSTANTSTVNGSAWYSTPTTNGFVWYSHDATQNGWHSVFGNATHSLGIYVNTQTVGATYGVQIGSNSNTGLGFYTNGGAVVQGISTNSVYIIKPLRIGSNTAPSFTLDVAGTASISGAVGFGSTFTVNGASVFNGVTNNGNGITVGTHSVGSTQSVTGNALFSSSVGIGALPNSSLVSLSIVKGTGRVDLGQVSSGNSGLWLLPSTSTANTTNYVLQQSGSDLLFNNGGTNIYFQTGGGTSRGVWNATGLRVGSSSSASATLDVTGTMSVSSTTSLNGLVNSSNIITSTFESTSNGFFDTKLRIGGIATPVANLDVTGTMSISSTSTIQGALTVNNNINAPVSNINAANFSINSGDGDIRSNTYGFQFRGYEAIAGALQEKFAFQSNRSKTGANYSFSFTPTSFTAQTASTEAPAFVVGTCTIGHATGAMSGARDYYHAAITHSAIGASILTNQISAEFSAPIAGTNVTLTNPLALHSNGNFSVTGSANATGSVAAAGNLYTQSAFEKANYGNVIVFSGSVIMANNFVANGGLSLNTTQPQPMGFKINGTEKWRIGINGGFTNAIAEPNAAAALDITSTTQGLLLPRMTTAQKNAIASPVAGLMVYDTTLNKLCIYTTVWETITSL